MCMLHQIIHGPDFQEVLKYLVEFSKAFEVG